MSAREFKYYQDMYHNNNSLFWRLPLSVLEAYYQYLYAKEVNSR